MSLPEIHRSEISNLVLTLKGLGVKNILEFDFIQPPSELALVRSLELLYSLGALDRQGNLTEVGKQILELGLDCRLAMAILKSNNESYRVTEEMITLAAMLTTQNLFLSNREPSSIAKNKKRFGAIEGDHITLVNIFNSWSHAKDKGSFCKDLCLNQQAIT